ncbi:exported hypothetical protein [Vibrio nigripulchritudo MADA3029]|uniref:hypothetical protein n=1 Tax=Vibrio nigripulchritudo TaxID=28173 RepID=UPI0003B1B414|nr:hypothetical protein [Vibrio nigripulchritudo]CCN33231.1 exported hypothetical protein [Vibrio nigripulchritudo AM115]CCN42272.1 exported hypothetical protein [Vibrio nigripulchritudo FTn2]CCN45322.1 exported hypothetical protein [Vibrio nigripulchritudo MADA3020]CCN51770.1 exported hypothetical protein [Vibrio nigripulchritudo MADA3021]CCN61934.1 exported hypothetical protein [Vibrio nigripulchritudo MADA3029]
MKRLIQLTMISSMLLTSNVALAKSSGWRDIKEIGCHLNDGTCYANLDAAVGPAKCNSTSIRWNKDNAASGKETLSLLMTASAAGKKVRFNVVDTCYGIYPTFNYIVVQMQ